VNAGVEDIMSELWRFGSEGWNQNAKVRAEAPATALGDLAGDPPTRHSQRGAWSTTTQFWPPNPNALAIAIRVDISRACRGT
jgi:hypothetical protein